MITAMGDIMREAHRRGWITTRDGNISLRRRGSKHMYITPSGWRKTILFPEHMIKIEICPSGLIIPEGVKPSGELDMHSYLQRDAVGTRAVVHLHPTNIIAAMYVGANPWDAFEHIERLEHVCEIVLKSGKIPYRTRRF